MMILSFARWKTAGLCYFDERGAVERFQMKEDPATRITSGSTCSLEGSLVAQKYAEGTKK